ncbi:DUF2919 domain-containing protein [Aeromonas bivalvium]|uniref:DUF2919 domain-containing protein n=1 Tax=Aeromonas bivalvium TaxID=440079 RepID=UPI000DD07229|nr:DUF2919 domain-containing protein [Aeromonas bivalvium]
MTLYPDHRYDDHGQLRPPLWFWPIALLLTRAVWLFLMAGATRQGGSELLALLYPERWSLYLSLLTDLPALLALLACGGTFASPDGWRARLRRLSPQLLIVSALGGLAMQIHALMSLGWQFSWLNALVLIASLWSLWYLLRSRQLREYAADRPHGQDA